MRILQSREKDKAMNEQNDKGQTGDSANNEVGPTEKLRESDKAEGELSVPGAQNPGSEEIKDEKAPNSE
jgi:hypothetical protein